MILKIPKIYFLSLNLNNNISNISNESNSVFENIYDKNKESNLKFDDKIENKSVQKELLFKSDNSGNNSLFNSKKEKNNLIEDKKDAKNENIFGNSGIFGESNDNNKNVSLFGNKEKLENKSLFSF